MLLKPKVVRSDVVSISKQKNSEVDTISTKECDEDIFKRLMYIIIMSINVTLLIQLSQFKILKF